MKFSIIIACYNIGELVKKAIDSCVNQREIPPEEFEIIVINDGSTDDTLNYILQYEEISNLRIIDKPNGGLSHTRNVGLSEAKGEYILFLDGDDWYSDDALATLSKYCKCYDVIVFPMSYYFSEDKCNTNLVGLHQGLYKRDDFLHQTLGKKQFYIIPAQKKAYRRNFLLDNKIKFVEGILHEDNPFFLDVMNVCDEVFYLDKSIYYYRQKRDGSITSKHSIRNFKGVMDGIDHVERLDIEKNHDVRFLNGNMLVFQVIKYDSLKDTNEAYKELRSKKNKLRALKYLFSETFHLKHTIRMILLIIDPIALSFLFKIYGK